MRSKTEYNRKAPLSDNGKCLRHTGQPYRFIDVPALVRKRRRHCCIYVFINRYKRLVENRFYNNHGAYCAERFLRRYNKQLRQACMEQTQDHYGYRIVRYRNSIICRDKAAIRRSILSLRAHNKRLFAAEKQMTRSVSAM